MSSTMYVSRYTGLAIASFVYVLIAAICFF